MFFFVIWGWRGFTRTKQSGEFFCPQCQADRTYSWKSVRRWFTLFWIPVIPLNHLGEYIDCHRCASAWDPKVLEIATDTEIRSNNEAAVRSLIAGMLLADRTVTEDERAVAVSVGRALVSEDYSLSDLEGDLDAFHADGLMSDLARFAGTVNPEGKALLLQAASMLAAADGNLAAEEEELIFTIGESLGLPDRSTREIVLATLSPDQESD